MFFGAPSTAKVAPDTGMRVQTALAGMPIAVGMGQFRTSWNLIDYIDFKSKQQSAGGKGVLGGAGKGGGGSYTYSATVVGAIVEGPMTVLNVWNNQTQQSTSSLGLTVFAGSYSQAAWSYMAGAHPDRADTYRGLCYAACADMALGNTSALPNFSFECRNTDFSNAIPDKPDADPKDWFTQVLTNTHYGIAFPSGMVGDLSVYSSYCRAAGLVVSPVISGTTSSVSQLLGNLLDATNSQARTSSGKVEIVPRGDEDLSANGAVYTAPAAPIYDLTDSDFITSGDSKPIKVSRKRASDQFNIVQVRFANRAQAYNADVARATDDAALNQYGPRVQQPQDWGVFSDPDAAQLSANLWLGRQHYRNSYEFTIGRRFVRLDCLDIVSLTHSGQQIEDQWVKITDIDRNSDGTFKITAEDYLPGTGAAPLYGKQANSGTTPNYNISPGDTNAPVAFMPPYQLAESRGPELWLLASGASQWWGGCQVWLSADGTNYRLVDTITGKARQGVLSADIAAGADPDTTNTLSVDLTESAGTLDSATQAVADALQSLMFVDGELMAYETATLNAPSRYDITYLRRAAYGTANTEHESGAPFAVLDGHGLLVYPFDKSQVGQTVYAKLPAFNIYGQALQELSDVEPITLVLGGAPTDYAPSGLTVTPTIKGNVLKWTNAINVGVEAVEIWRSATSSFAGATKVHDAAAYTTSWTDNGVTSNTAYYYWIRYRDVAGNTGGYDPSSASPGVGAITGQVQTGDLADGSVTGDKIADGTIPGAKFAAGLTVPQIVDSLPLSAAEGALVVLTTDGQLYRYHSGAWTTEVPAVNITGQVVNDQIAAAAIEASNFAASIRPVQVGSSLPGSATEGDQFYLTTDGQTYRYHSSAWTVAVPATNVTGQIVNSQIAAGAIAASNFATGITPVQIVSSLPAVTGADNGKVATLSTDGKLYRVVSGTWVRTVDGADLLANSIVAAKVAAGAIGTTQLAANAVTASKVFIGDTDNLILDSDTSDASYWNNGGFSNAISTVFVGSSVYPSDTVIKSSTVIGAISLVQSAIVAVKPGDWIYCELSAATNPSASTFTVYLIQYDLVGAQVSSQAVGLIAPNAGINTASNRLQVAANIYGIALRIQATSDTGISDYAFARPIMRRMQTGTLIVDGTITASNIAVGTITAAQIQSGTITSSQLAANSITAGKIAAGAVGASQVAAGAITASKIFVGDTSNLVTDSTCTDAAYWEVGGNNTAVAGGGALAPWLSATLISTLTHPSNYSVVRSARVKCNPGDWFFGSVQAYLTPGGGVTLDVYVIWYDIHNVQFGASGIGSITAGTITLVSNSVQAPAGTGFCTLGLQTAPTGGSTQYLWEFVAPVLRLMNTGTLTVDGTITGQKIAAGTITASNIQAATITGTQIASNTITSSHLTANSVTAGAIAAGAINASTIIVANIIVTGHLVANAVTNSSAAVGSSSTMARSSTVSQVVFVGFTSTGGPVLVQLTDYFTRSSGHSPLAKYIIQRDGTTIGTIYSGGSGVTANQPVALSILDTSAGAALHSYTASCGIGWDGSDDPSCISQTPCLVVTELKR